MKRTFRTLLGACAPALSFVLGILFMRVSILYEDWRAIPWVLVTALCLATPPLRRRRIILGLLAIAYFGCLTAMGVLLFKLAEQTFGGLGVTALTPFVGLGIMWLAGRRIMAEDSDTNATPLGTWMTLVAGDLQVQLRRLRKGGWRSPALWLSIGRNTVEDVGWRERITTIRIGKTPEASLSYTATVGSYAIRRYGNIARMTNG